MKEKLQRPYKKRAFWQNFERTFTQNAYNSFLSDNFKTEIGHNLRIPVRNPVRREEKLGGLLQVRNYKTAILKHRCKTQARQARSKKRLGKRFITGSNLIIKRISSEEKNREIVVQIQPRNRIKLNLNDLNTQLNSSICSSDHPIQNHPSKPSKLVSKRPRALQKAVPQSQSPPESPTFSFFSKTSPKSPAIFIEDPSKSLRATGLIKYSHLPKFTPTPTGIHQGSDEKLL